MARARPVTRRALRVGRRGRAAAGVALLLLGTGATSAFAGDNGFAGRDVQLVYCLAPAHRTDLLAAAVRLDLLKADVRVTPEQWARDHSDDFGRACMALMAAESDSPATAGQDDGAADNWFIDLVKQLPLLLAGALLTLAGQAYERTGSERRSLRQELRSAESAYRGAAQDYLTEYRQDPQAGHSAVRAARDALAVVLSRVSGPPARRAAAGRLADELPLAEPLPQSDGRYLLDSEALSRHADTAHSSVERCLRSITELDRSSLYWSWITVRNRPVRSRAARGAE